MPDYISVIYHLPLLAVGANVNDLWKVDLFIRS